MRFVFTLLMAIEATLLGGCSPSEKEEYWDGYYLYPNHNRRFEIFMELAISGEKISGAAYQGGDKVATLIGEVKEGRYSLLLHPIDEGQSTEQGVRYRGRRSNNKIVGQWEHAVGVKGHWQMNLTKLTYEKIWELKRAECEKKNQSIAFEAGEDCENGA